MSVVSVIRAAMALKGFTRSALAAALGVPGSALGNKLARGSFSMDDGVRVAAALGYRLALVDEAGSVVLAFSPEGIAPPRRSGARSGVSSAESSSGSDSAVTP